MATATATKKASYEVIEAMETYGGGFASAIARAWLKADDQNQARLMTAFGHLYDEYEAMRRGNCPSKSRDGHHSERGTIPECMQEDHLTTRDEEADQ